MQHRAAVTYIHILAHYTGMELNVRRSYDIETCWNLTRNLGPLLNVCNNSVEKYTPKNHLKLVDWEGWKIEKGNIILAITNRFLPYCLRTKSFILLLPFADEVMIMIMLKSYRCFGGLKNWITLRYYCEKPTLFSMIKKADRLFLFALVPNL